MAYSINRTVVLGNLARDAESRSFANGGKVVNLRVATSEQWKDRTTGEKKERTEYHSVAVFSDFLCERAEGLRKGTRVYVEGQLQTRKWTDNQGQDRYSTEIVLQGPGAHLEACDTGRGRGGVSSAQQPHPGAHGGESSTGGWGNDDLDDDVPF